MPTVTIVVTARLEYGVMSSSPKTLAKPQIPKKPDTAKADATSDARSSVGTSARLSNRSFRVSLVPSTREDGDGGSIVRVDWRAPNLLRPPFRKERDMMPAMAPGISVLTVACETERTIISASQDTNWIRHKEITTLVDLFP